MLLIVFPHVYPIRRLFPAHGLQCCRVFAARTVNPDAELELVSCVDDHNEDILGMVSAVRRFVCLVDTGASLA